MSLYKDLREFIELLNSHGVEYLVVGAHCLAFHGVARNTGDLDFFVRVSPENAERIADVVRAFGFASTGLSAKDFLEPHQVVQLGIAPYRIDILTGIDSVDFDEAWSWRVPGQLDSLRVNYLSKDLFIRNKLAVGRSQDIADANRLREMDSDQGDTKR
jgi:hypothetical protein